MENITKKILHCFDGFVFYPATISTLVSLKICFSEWYYRIVILIKITHMGSNNLIKVDTQWGSLKN